MVPAERVYVHDEHGESRVFVLFWLQKSDVNTRTRRAVTAAVTETFSSSWSYGQRARVQPGYGGLWCEG